jgi:hypothetical protein
MQELTFVVEPGIGPGKFPQRGSLADLVLRLPYVVTDEIPPRRILNDVLRRGNLDAGMSGGCLWEPLEIGDAEYRELVQLLQRRGTRPVAGRDPGGKPFGVGDAPDSVRTYTQWVAHRSQRKPGSSPSRPRLTRDEDSSTRPDEWLERLPVADLYLGYLASLNTDWRGLSDDSFDLPPVLVSKLRELADLHDVWRYGRTGRRGSEYRRWLGDLSTQTAQVRAEARDCVDRLGLPRWPFRRFPVVAP